MKKTWCWQYILICTLTSRMGFISQRMRWYFKYKRWVSLVKDTSMAIMEYKFLNKEGEEIQVT